MHNPNRRYYRRPWRESRGDRWDSWGASVWYFEADEKLVPIRQIEVYESGPTLRFGPDHPEDEFGALGYGTLGDEQEWTAWEISAAEFESVWFEEG